MECQKIFNNDKKRSMMQKKSHKANENNIESKDKQIRRELIKSGYCFFTAILCASTCVGIPIAICAGKSAFNHLDKGMALSEEEENRARAALAAQIGVVEPTKVNSQQMTDMPQEMVGPRPF